MLILPNGNILYECDREMNTECKHKLHCDNGLTDCHMTSNIKFASYKEDFIERSLSLQEEE